jgi:DNA-binding transcriptional LysR family regulator
MQTILFEGKRFLTHVTVSMDALHEARKSISSKSSEEVKGHIVIGMVTPASALTDRLWSYAKKSPFVNFTINSIAGQEHSPNTQKLDFLIGYDFTNHPNYERLSKRNRPGCQRSDFV